MSKPIIRELRRKRARIWVIRFIKFNLIGIVVFLIGTAIFTTFFSYLGAWAWMIANGTGSILQFSLISYFNSKKSSVIFEQCPAT